VRRSPLVTRTALIKASGVVTPPVDGSDVAVCILPRAPDVVAGTVVVTGTVVVVGAMVVAGTVVVVGAMVVAGTVVVVGAMVDVVEDGPTLGSGLPPRETRT
jgi:hypothetical protein